jgi:hypothetical protein
MYCGFRIQLYTHILEYIIIGNKGNSFFLHVKCLISKLHQSFDKKSTEK